MKVPTLPVSIQANSINAPREENKFHQMSNVKHQLCMTSFQGSGFDEEEEEEGEERKQSQGGRQKPEVKVGKQRSDLNNRLNDGED